MLFILNTKQVTVGVAVNGSPSSMPYFDDLHTESLEGVSTYEFSVPAEHEESNKIEVNGYVIVRDLDNKHLLFTIKEIEEVHSDAKRIKNVFCENTAIDELLGDVVRPMNLPSTTLENAVDTVMANSSGWIVGDIEYTTSQDFEVTEYSTVLETLRAIQAQFSCEIYFTVELAGTQIISKKVNVVKERGTETNVRFDYSYDLRGVGRTEDSTRVITAIVPVGKGDATGKRVQLSTYPAFNEGDFYKNSQVDWIGSESALDRWGKDGKHIFGIYVDDNVTTQAELKRKAINELSKRIQPYTLYSSAISNFERITGYEAKKVRLGDRVHIKDITFDPVLAISARVQMIKRSYTDLTKDEIDLGDYKPLTLSVSPEIKKLQQLISLNEEKWNAYRLEILSFGGTVFKNGTGTTNLTAKVYKGNEEIDLNGTEYLYKWYKYDKDGTLVQWAAGTDYKSGKTATVTHADIDIKATISLVLETIT